MKHTFVPRALCCAAINLAGAAFASGYTVVELPVKAAGKHGVVATADATAIAPDGRTLINVRTDFQDGAATLTS